MILSRTSLHFCVVDTRSRTQLHMAGALITFRDCLVFVFFLNRVIYSVITAKGAVT